MTTLGFLVFVGWDRPEHAGRSLESGIDLFRTAETLGYSSGRVRVRRHSPALSAPFPFLTAVARETSRIRLGTAVLPIGTEDVLRLAEDAATTDLLSGGRLELGVSAAGLAPQPADLEERERWAIDRLASLRGALAGESLGEPYESWFAATARPGGTFDDPQPKRQRPTATPVSPGIAGRLWYGAGTVASAMRAARLGYDLLLSTLNGEFVPGGLASAQARQIEAYREEFARHHRNRTPRVAVSRSILPLVTHQDQERFGDLVARYRGLVDSEGRFEGTPATTQWSPLYGGEAARVVDDLAADPSLALADEVLLTPISDLGLQTLPRVLESVAAEIAPALGWTL